MPEENKWVDWTEPYSSFSIDSKLTPSDFMQILVPNTDFARTSWLM